MQITQTNDDHFFNVIQIFFFFFCLSSSLFFCVESQGQKEIDELSRKLEEMYKLHDDTLHELESLQSEYRDHLMEKVIIFFIFDTDHRMVSFR